MTMADKIVVKEGGHIRQGGAPLEAYDRPTTTFVAGFIGSPAMNMLDATVRHENGGLIAEVAGTKLQLVGAGLDDGQEVILRVRPEHLLPDSEGLPGQVAVVEPTGAEMHIIARIGLIDVTAVLRERREVRPGQQIHLAAAPHAFHVFDQKSGARIG